MKLRLPLFALSLVSMASGIVVGCSKADEPSVGSGASLVLPQPGDELADAEPRRVCPSDRYPDGGWVKVDGLDVSDYEFVEWDRLVRDNPNMKYSFTRVSSGLVRIDSRFHHDWVDMKRVGLIRGAYQYFKPSQSAIAQANLYLQRMDLMGGFQADDFPPVLDFETSNGMPTDTVVCRVKLWLARVERATHRLPIVYTSNQQSMYLAREFARYPLWVPNYVGTPSVTCPLMPAAWDKWTMWQYGGAPLSGVWSNGDRTDPDGGFIAQDGGPVKAEADVNYYDGTFEKLVAFVASTTSDGNVADPAPLAHPPHVRPSPDITGPIDCDDGCCILDHAAAE